MPAATSSSRCASRAGTAPERLLQLHVHELALLHAPRKSTPLLDPVLDLRGVPHLGDDLVRLVATDGLERAIGAAGDRHRLLARDLTRSDSGLRGALSLAARRHGDGLLPRAAGSQRPHVAQLSRLRLAFDGAV